MSKLPPPPRVTVDGVPLSFIAHKPDCRSHHSISFDGLGGHHDCSCGLTELLRQRLGPDCRCRYEWSPCKGDRRCPVHGLPRHLETRVDDFFEHATQPSEGGEDG